MRILTSSYSSSLIVHASYKIFTRVPISDFRKFFKTRNLVHVNVSQDFNVKMFNILNSSNKFSLFIFIINGLFSYFELYLCIIRILHLWILADFAPTKSFRKFRLGIFWVHFLNILTWWLSIDSVLTAIHHLNHFIWSESIVPLFIIQISWLRLQTSLKFGWIWCAYTCLILIFKKRDGRL